MKYIKMIGFLVFEVCLLDWLKIPHTDARYWGIIVGLSFAFVFSAER